MREDQMSPRERSKSYAEKKLGKSMNKILTDLSQPRKTLLGDVSEKIGIKTLDN